MNSEPMTFESVIEGGLQNAIDISTDLAEIAIDNILVDGVLRNTPLVKETLAVVKFSYSVNDWFFIKKILVFFQELHRGNINPVKYQKFLDKFKTNQKYRNKIVEQIVIYNNRFIDIQKSKVLPNLLLAHIYGKIDFETYTEIAQGLEALNTKGLKVITQLTKMDGNEQAYQSVATRGDVRRDSFLLLSAGLAYLLNERSIRLNKLGVCLLKYGIEKDFNFTYKEEN